MSREERDAIAQALRDRNAGQRAALARGEPPPTPAQRRTGWDAFCLRYWPDAAEPPPLIDLGSGLRGRMVEPRGGVRGEALGTLVWLHGGGFALGSSAGWAPMARMIADVSGWAVLLPDYRLIPEHPFPAALDDAVAAVRSAAAHCRAVAVGGDSAGGNLALAAAQRLAGEGESPLAGVWLMSAYLDLTHSGGTWRTRAARDPFIGAADGPNRHYAPDRDPGDPAVSPLFGDMAGLPPTLLQWGSEEVLADDSRVCADRLRAAGGTAVAQEWAGMFHVWPLFAGRLEEGRWALAQGGMWLCDLLV